MVALQDAENGRTRRHVLALMVDGPDDLLCLDMQRSLALGCIFPGCRLAAAAGGGLRLCRTVPIPQRLWTIQGHDENSFRDNYRRKSGWRNVAALRIQIQGRRCSASPSDRCPSSTSARLAEVVCSSR